MLKKISDGFLKTYCPKMYKISFNGKHFTYKYFYHLFQLITMIQMKVTMFLIVFPSFMATILNFWTPPPHKQQLYL
jgi:hypothetical protein